MRWKRYAHRLPLGRSCKIFGTREASRWSAWFLKHWANSSAWASVDDRVIDIEQFGNISSSIPTGENWEMSFPGFGGALFEEYRVGEKTETPGQRWRRFSKDYEYRVQTSETMLDIAAMRPMLNHLAPA